METRKTITLDARAQHRLYVLNHVLTAGLTAEEAAGVLELSVRQVRRLLRRYGADGAAGLIHGNRARVPGHRIPEAVRDRVVELATTTYVGVNHSHLAELLAEREGLAIAQRSLRRIQRLSDRHRWLRRLVEPGESPVGGPGETRRSPYGLLRHGMSTSLASLGPSPPCG